MIYYRTGSGVSSLSRGHPQTGQRKNNKKGHHKNGKPSGSFYKFHEEIGLDSYLQDPSPIKQIKNIKIEP
jgi:hypothetical protein